MGENNTLYRFYKRKLSVFSLFYQKKKKNLNLSSLIKTIN